LETFPKPICWLGMEKVNLTQQKHVFTNPEKCTTTKNKQNKKLKPCLVASYDIHYGHREGLLPFWCFINMSLTYLLIHLPTYSPRTHTQECLQHKIPQHWLQKHQTSIAVVNQLPTPYCRYATQQLLTQCAISACLLWLA